MGVKNYTLYKVTEHARVRIQERFNITKNEMDTWLNRLLSNSTFVKKQGVNREKYRLNDIVLVVDTKQRVVVTVYSENEHDDNEIKTHTNPEVKSAINDALRLMIKQKKVKTAVKTSELIEQMYEANQRMTSPFTNYRYTDRAWDEFVNIFQELKDIVDTGLSVIDEAEYKLAEG